MTKQANQNKVRWNIYSSENGVIDITTLDVDARTREEIIEAAAARGITVSEMLELVLACHPAYAAIKKEKAAGKDVPKIEPEAGEAP